MFNSLSMAQSGIEMTAVCNARLVRRGRVWLFARDPLRAREVWQAEASAARSRRPGSRSDSSVYRDGRDVPHHLALAPTWCSRVRATTAALLQGIAMLRTAAAATPRSTTDHMIGLELACRSERGVAQGATGADCFRSTLSHGKACTQAG